MFFSLRPHYVFRISKSSLVHINWCGLEVNGISVLYFFKINSSLMSGMSYLFVETSKEVIATVHLLADWIKFKT